jgi:protoporphyrinogen oxidase
MDYIIIGGGISGLYCAYKLSKKYPNAKIVVCEKENRIGGRVHTIYGNGFSLEAGAGRFNSKHKLLIELIEELGLKNKISKISSDFVYIDVNEKDKSYDIPFVSKLTMLIGEIVVYSKLYTNEQLQNVTIVDLATKILKKEDVEYIKSSFGYYSELVIMNAKDAIQLIVGNLNPMLQFYGLKDGLSEVIEKIKNKIKNNVEIKKNIEIKKIKYDEEFKLYTNKGIIKCKKCICAIPTKELQKINLFNSLDRLLSKIKCSPLCRIYSTFKKPWFSELPKLSTNNNLRMIIPISQGKINTIMMSYTDNKYAKHWLNVYKEGKKEKIEKELSKLVKETTNIDVPNPINTYMYYWECGVGYWGIGADSEKISKQLVKPFKEIEFYVCGEHYSEKNQQWIEGALETANEVIKII